MNRFGVPKVLEYLKQNSDCFVIIGGVAAYLALLDKGLPFRETHDFDIVILADGTDEAFNTGILRLLKDGGYERAVVNSKSVYYRFINPKQSEYPKVIELFAKNNTLLNRRLEKIHIAKDGEELSAIVLDDDMFNFINEHKIVSEAGLPIVDSLGLIVLKIYAYYKNKELYEQGKVTGKDKFEKHKRDVIRLLLSLTPEENRISLNTMFKNYCKSFVDVLAESGQTHKELTHNTVELERTIELYKSIFVTNE